MCTFQYVNFYKGGWFLLDGACEWNCLTFKNKVVVLKNVILFYLLNNFIVKPVPKLYFNLPKCQLFSICIIFYHKLLRYLMNFCVHLIFPQNISHFKRFCNFQTILLIFEIKMSRQLIKIFIAFKYNSTKQFCWIYSSWHWLSKLAYLTPTH